MRASLAGKAELQRIISCLLVQQLCVCGVPPLTPDGEARQTHAIQPHVDLLTLTYPDDGVHAGRVAPSEPHSDDILAVGGEIVVNGDSASRSERQLFMDTVVLHEPLGNEVTLDDRPGRRITGCQATDLARGQEVPFKKRWR